jgi:hypothetical protein
MNHTLTEARESAIALFVLDFLSDEGASHDLWIESNVLVHRILCKLVDEGFIGRDTGIMREVLDAIETTVAELEAPAVGLPQQIPKVSLLETAAAAPPLQEAAGVHLG